jgi:hypothetical protein
MGSEIQTKFEKMGARIKISVTPEWVMRRNRRAPRWAGDQGPQPVSIDIRRDDAGEYFDLRCRRDVDVRVLDVRAADRHLLLSAHVPAENTGQAADSRFLCGHDERSWFVAAVPERARAGTVQHAKDALKPPEVWDAIREYGLPMKNRDDRRNKAFIRQGEWFFIPRPRLKVNDKLVLRHEPIRRGAGKPHMCQFLYRTGGQQVYVCSKYPNGLTGDEYRDLPVSEQRRYYWQLMTRDARVYAKGAIRHPDHKTVWLSLWHQVVMNTETEAAAMRHVAFLD